MFFKIFVALLNSSRSIIPLIHTPVAFKQKFVFCSVAKLPLKVENSAHF